MDIPEEPGAFLVSILVIAMFLFLFALQRWSLSERQQTGVWIVFTIFLFSICSLFFRGGAQAGASADRSAGSHAVPSVRQAGLGK